jgi:hypothetical protein
MADSELDEIKKLVKGSLSGEIANLKRQIEDLRKQLALKDRTIADAKRVVTIKNNTIKRLQTQAKQANDIVAGSEKERKWIRQAADRVIKAHDQIDKLKKMPISEVLKNESYSWEAISKNRREANAIRQLKKELTKTATKKRASKFASDGS